MAVPSDEHESTLALAQIALEQIRALHQPALPRNFEIWYQYATGHYPNLNKSINDILSQNGALSDADMDQIYGTHLSPSRLSNQIDTVGSRMVDEIKQVLDMIDTAAGSATTYSASLADASAKLQGANDGAALRAVIERLVTGAKEMEQSNKKLEATAYGFAPGDRAASAKSRNRADREFHRPAHHVVQPQILRSGAGRKY